MRLLADIGYGILATASAPIWLPRMLYTGKHRTDWRARFGWLNPLPAKGSRPRVLIHAVSVGEVNAVRLLVESLAMQVEVVLAVTTDTGFARALSLFGNDHQVVRYPLDFSGCVNRFLDAVRPDVVVLVELEVWPNFVASCELSDVPVCVINGRLTARSHQRYRLIKPLVQNTFQRLSCVGVQSPTYAARFCDLGTTPDRVHVTGTMKWDTAQIADSVPGADTLAEEMGIDRSRPLVVAGSTAPGEHELLHAIMPPHVQLLCAPRKPEWFDQAARAMPGCVRRSDTANHRIAGSPMPRLRFLLDTIGELRMSYALADVVIIGRTFIDLGGSDMIESIALGKPTIVGPHVSNFQDVVDALLKGGGLLQTSVDELKGVLAELLVQPNRQRELAERGRAVIRTQQGSTQRHCEMILNALASRKGMK